MRAAIAQARDHINLETYILEEGEVADKLAALLEKKAGEGVKVSVLYDAVGSLKIKQEYLQRLEKAGIQVCAFNPVKNVHKVNNRDHRKILVVDGRIAFTGGVNVSEAYASSSLAARRRSEPEKVKAKEGWRDTQVRAEGPVAAQFQRAFLDSWVLQDCGPAAEAKYFPKLDPRGTARARLVKADPQSQESEMYGELLKAIGGAKARVWLAFGYFVPDPRTKQTLINAARRGVDVRLVLPGFSDFWAPVYAGRSHYDELLAAGVRIYEWREALMHAKTAVVDSRWASVGSTNLDWRSFVHNYEADLVVDDPAFARTLEERYSKDLEAATPIEAEAWRRRGTTTKLKEWVARQWEYLL
ncbi:MAG TPA: phospholipase D-like domain-containing protein [Burkholderiales bacterium]|nr:phospholipase D-like domain-containing protein [Burkholderiales bacterium]